MNFTPRLTSVLTRLGIFTISGGTWCSVLSGSTSILSANSAQYYLCYLLPKTLFQYALLHSYEFTN